LISVCLASVRGEQLVEPWTVLAIDLL